MIMWLSSDVYLCFLSDQRPEESELIRVERDLQRGEDTGRRETCREERRTQGEDRPTERKGGHREKRDLQRRGHREERDLQRGEDTERRETDREEKTQGEGQETYSEERTRGEERRTERRGNREKRDLQRGGHSEERELQRGVDKGSG